MTNIPALSQTQSMKVILVGLNARYTHSSLSLLYLRRALADIGIQAQIREFHISMPQLEILEGICAKGADVLLFSVYIWNSLLVRKLLPDIHALLPQAALVLGGPEAGFQAREWLQDLPFLSAIVRGAGEAAIQKLAAVGFRPTVKIIEEAGAPFSDIPFPYLPEDFPRMAHRYIYYESSRGCPFSCAYCISSISGLALAEKPLELVKKELAIILAQESSLPEAPIVKFIDRSFNAHPERARGIWEFLMAAQSSGVFHFELHPALLEEEDFRLLAKSPPGRFQFELGVQSVNPVALAQVRRAMDWPRSRENIRRLIGLGIAHIHLDLIVGLPGDDIASCALGINELLALKPQMLHLGFLKLLPGTELEAKAGELGILAMGQAPYQVLRTKDLSFEDICRLKMIEELIDSVWNANHCEAELDALAQLKGGYFAALSYLADIHAQEGFNPSTRQAHKVKAFLDRALLG